MSRDPSEAIKLYGTEEPVEPMRGLTAGPLSVEFDQGTLRYIKLHGKEAIRNIAFVVRDEDWGTYQPALGNLRIEQRADGFSIEFDAICGDDRQELRYRATIDGKANGSLTFSGEYETATGFRTNRTGFVVLHPLQGVAGRPLTVEKVDGSVVESEFPELVDPVQPFQEIRALTHEVLPGVSVCCRMTGDSYEMEDHRQWNDASYKTYVRPLALPWPYDIAAGEVHRQAVSLTIEGDIGQPGGQGSSQQGDRCVVTIGAGDGLSRMPRIGLGLEPQQLAGARAHLDLLRYLELQQLVIWHELDKNGSDDLEQAGEIGRDIGADLVLHAVIPDEDYAAEVAELAARCREAGLSPAAISVTPAIYLSSITPGSSWPDVTPLADLYDEVRNRFPGVMLGGGMLSFFPELNRHRPPTAHLDYVTHASNTITHACDDMTVTENLEAIPYIVKTCRSFAGGKAYHVGPSSIGMRFNPYGSRTMDNPGNTRIAMARMDPRQRGLLNAAWTVGYVAHLARGGIDTVNLHAPTGEFGIIYHPQDWRQPGFDDSNRRVYPVFHCVAGFARAAGKFQLPTRSSMSREVQAVAYEDDGRQILWLANLTGDTRSVVVDGLLCDSGEIASISPDTFAPCTERADGLERTRESGRIDSLQLGAYSVARLTASATGPAIRE